MNFRLASAFPRVNLMIAHLLFLQQLSRYINEGREVKRILNNLQMMSCRKWLTEKDEASKPKMLHDYSKLVYINGKYERKRLRIVCEGLREPNVAMTVD